MHHHTTQLSHTPWQACAANTPTRQHATHMWCRAQVQAHRLRLQPHTHTPPPPQLSSHPHGPRLATNSEHNHTLVCGCEPPVTHNNSSVPSKVHQGAQEAGTGGQVRRKQDNIPDRPPQETRTQTGKQAGVQKAQALSTIPGKTHEARQDTSGKAQARKKAVACHMAASCESETKRRETGPADAACTDTDARSHWPKAHQLRVSSCKTNTQM
jgi:hypothetical protein